MRTTLLIVSLLATGCTKKKEAPVTEPDKGSGSGSAEAKLPPADDAKLVDEAKKFLADSDKELRRVLVGAAEAEWANATDITDAHEAAESKAKGIQNDTIAKLIKQARKYEPVIDKLDPANKRQLQVLIYMLTIATPVAPSPDDPAKSAELAKTAAEMSSIYGKGKVDGKDLDALSKILQKSRKPDELVAAWKGWHDTVGRAERDLYIKYVGLANEGAKAIGFTDVASMWKSGYDMPADAFEAEVDRLYTQMKPLYEQLHCYTRAKLNKMYGDKVQPATGPIPTHITGNMWGQTWGYLYPELEPYKGEAAIDVTPAIEKKLTDKQMVQLGEAFYTSLGMPALPPTFWERSMFQKPAGKEAVCHASAWDVTFSNDLRIKMCINKNQEDLDTIHHELGHNYYQMAYHKEPILFQNAAHDGFHEAIGDTVVLSMTPEYLKEKGLLDTVTKNDKVTINRQMNTALDKIAFAPFGLVVDKWRWDVFSGKVKPENYNSHWWTLRKQYQGIAPPMERAATDFDPGAKYHVPGNVPYMRYFLALVLQFQFHRALCKKAGHTGPLNECSIYNNKAAGAAYWKMLQQGSNKPWQEILFDLTGEKAMDATAILEYFAPLQTWLVTENKGQTCGW